MVLRRPSRLLLATLITGSFALATLPVQAQTRESATVVETAPEVVANEIVIGIPPTPNAPLAGAVYRQNMQSWMRTSLGAIVEETPQVGTYRVRLRPGISLSQALQAARLRGASFAEPNYVVHAYGSTPNDASSSGQWALGKVGMPDAWPLWNPTATTIVAIIDTGVALTHPDLSNKLLRDLSGNVIGYDFVNNDSNPSDDHGHGTHCAGIAAAQINNGVGVAGIAGWNGSASSDTTYTQIMPIKVLASNGSGSTASVANGVIWAADHGAKVISLSLGSTSNSVSLGNAIAYAWGKGCVVVAAAGNAGSSTKSYPAAYPNVISVASTGQSDVLSGFSNHGTWVNCAAPGENILSTVRTSSQYGWMSGTSMATPLVAGEAALLMSHAPDLSNQQIKDTILNNVDPVTPYSGRTISGGRVNVFKALSSLGSTSDPIVPPPGPTVPLNLVVNPSFDFDLVNSQSPTGWSTWTPNGTGYADYTEAHSWGAHSGVRNGSHWTNKANYDVYTYQTISALPNGLYTLKAWVRGSGGQTVAQVGAKNYGGGWVYANIPATTTWTQVVIPNINVTNGRCEIGIYSRANSNQWVHFDDVEFFKQL